MFWLFKFSSNSGQVPSVAERSFLSSVKGLDMYGVDPHPCKVSQVKVATIIAGLHLLSTLLVTAVYRLHVAYEPSSSQVSQ